MLSILLTLASAQSLEQGGVTLDAVHAVTSEYASSDRLDAVAVDGGTVYAAGSAFSSWGSHWALRARSLADGTPLWSVDFELSQGMNDAGVNDLALAADGGTLFVGGHLAVTDPLDVDAAVIAFDAADGSVLWSRLIDGAGLDDDVAALAVSPDGALLALTGFVDAGPGAPAKQFLVAVLSTVDGALLWEWRFDDNPAADLADEGLALAWAPDGARLFATGFSGTGVVKSVYSTFAFDAAGALVWSHRYSDPAPTNSRPEGIATNGVQVVVAGRHTQSSPAFNLPGTLALDAATGQFLWSGSGGGGSLTNGSRAVVAVADDFIVAEAASNSFSDSEWIAVRFDGATGTREWEQVHSEPAFPLDKLEPEAIAFDPVTDVVVVAGDVDLQQLSAAFDSDGLTIAYDATAGTTLWTENWTAPGANDDFTLDLALGGGRTAAVGRSFVPEQGDNYTVRARDLASGQLIWAAVEEDTASAANVARAVVLEPVSGDLFTVGNVAGGAKAVAQCARVSGDDGRLIWVHDDDPGTVTGGRFHAARLSTDGATLFAAGGTGSDLLVVALNTATGAVLWRRSYDGPGSTFDEAYDLHLSADGLTIIACGAFDGPLIFQGGNEGFLVLALEAATGVERWTATHNPSFKAERARLLCASADDTVVYVVGERDTGSTFVELDVEVLALDAITGAPLWTATHGLGDQFFGPWGDEPLAARASFDGSQLVICGASQRGSAEGRASLWTLDATDGSLAALQHVVTAGWVLDGLGAAIADDGSTAVMVGRAQTPDGAIAAGFDITGAAPPWATAFTGAIEPYFDAVTLAGDGLTARIVGGDDGERLLTRAVDARDGTLLWSAEYEPTGAGDAIGTDRDRTAAFDDARRRLWSGGAGPTAGTDIDALLLAYADPTLLGDAAALSLSAGGTQTLTARAGTAYAGDVYVLVGSLSGTTPGLPLAPGVTLPLVVDAYTLLTLNDPAAFLPNSVGLLDATGGADLALVLPPGTNPAVAGLTAHHAFVALDLGPPGLALVLASNAIGATLGP